MRKEQRVKNNGKVIKYITLLFIVYYLFFAISCPVNVAVPQQEQLPPGKGSFTLRLSDRASRTIFPQTPVLNYFTRFQIILVNQDNSDFNVTIDDAERTGDQFVPVVLVPGTYDITVNAYKDSELAATGFLTDLEIEARIDTEETIILKVLINQGAGNFNYNISLAGVTNLEKIKGSLKIISDDNIVVHTREDLTNIKNILTIDNFLTGQLTNTPSGLYTVVLELDEFADADNATLITRTLKWSEILHVYSTLTSNWAPPASVFTDAYFSTTFYNVIFNHNFEDGDGITRTTTKSFFHGSSMAAPSDRPVPVRDTFTLDGWHKVPNSQLTCGTSCISCPDRWVYTDPIYANMTLYAIWTRNAAIINIEVEPVPDFNPEYTLSDPSVVVAGVITLSRSGAVYPGSVDVNIDLDDFDAGSVVWEIFGTGIYSDISISNAATFTLDSAISNYNTLGGHLLRLTVEKDEIKYMLNIPFRIIQ